MYEKQDLLTLYDRAPLNARYWASIGLVVVISIFDFFDFFLIGFLVAVLGPQWHLSYGQTSLMLLSAGVGAIIGALAWGLLADRFGRKTLFVSGVLICGVSAPSVALLPDGAWVMFAALRFLVGFGIGGAAAAVVPIIVEYTPTRHRTVISSITVIPVSIGILLASITAATLLPILGWRSIAALGIAPVIPAIMIAVIMPESVRSLISRGRLAEARATAAWAMEVPVQTLPLPQVSISNAGLPRSGFGELLNEPRRLWLTIIMWVGASTASYGVFLWGPTIVALLLGLAPQDAAHLFIYVSLTGIVGRTIFAFLPNRLGRRRCGEIMGYGSAVTLAAAGIFHDRFIGDFSIFMLLLILASLFFDGGFSNLTPYSAEIFPVRLSARGVGIAQAANGVGKIAGPLCLALIAGTGNLLTPKATADAVTPAFLFLAACGLAVGLAFTLLGVETHGRPLALEKIPKEEREAARDTSRRSATSMAKDTDVVHGPARGQSADPDLVYTKRAGDR